MIMSAPPFLCEVLRYLGTWVSAKKGGMVESHRFHIEKRIWWDVNCFKLAMR